MISSLRRWTSKGNLNEEVITDASSGSSSGSHQEGKPRSSLQTAAAAAAAASSAPPPRHNNNNNTSKSSNPKHAVKNNTTKANNSSVTKWNTLKSSAPTAQAKADLQDIINKHQQAALLEANDTIRALEEQREEHRMLLQEQQMTIDTLKETMKLLQQQAQENEQQQAQQQQQQEKANHSHDRNNNNNGNNSQSQDEEIRALRTQLQERDALIRELQEGSSTLLTLEDESSQRAEKLQKQVESLEIEVQNLTHKNQEQQEEIQKLENILNEIESFQQLQQPTLLLDNDNDTASTTTPTSSKKTTPNRKSKTTKIGTPKSTILHEYDGSLPSILEESSEELSPIKESLSSRYDEEDDEHDEDDEDFEEISESSHDLEEAGLALLNGHTSPFQPPPSPPRPKTMTLNGNQLLLLFSSMPMNSMVAANQSRLETILQSLDLSLEGAASDIQVLDGCDPDPASINLRNDLFRISGLPAKYPQLFLVNFAANDIKFVGDFDALQEYHDNNTLAATIGLTPIKDNHHDKDP